jgi:hypothetical protein
MSHESEISKVVSLLAADMASLHPRHRAALQRALITPRKVPVTEAPGGFVVAVAGFGGKLLYWSDIDEGWELEAPDARGDLAARGCNQFELRHVLYPALGDPDAAACRSSPT